jgi:hypothetical protein
MTCNLYFVTCKFLNIVQRAPEKQVENSPAVLTHIIIRLVLKVKHCGNVAKIVTKKGCVKTQFTSVRSAKLVFA